MLQNRKIFCESYTLNQYLTVSQCPNVSHIRKQNKNTLDF